MSACSWPFSEGRERLLVQPMTRNIGPAEVVHVLTSARSATLTVS